MNGRPESGLAEADDRAEPVDAGEGIAVVGVGCVAPGVDSPEALWALLSEGEPVFGEPGGRWSADAYSASGPGVPDKNYARELGFVTTQPTDAAHDEDYLTTWLRTALTQAWAQATVPPGARTALIVGGTPEGSQHLEETYLATALREHCADLPGGRRLAELGEKHLRHSLHRPERGLLHVGVWLAASGILPDTAEVVTVDTACSSSLYSIDIGMRRLRSGSCDVAVCGGTVALTPRTTCLFANLQGFSPTGALRSFDADADGTLFSDGAGVVVLKTLEKARLDGDEVLAVLTGVGVSADGRGKSIYAPYGAGQRFALERAYRAGPARRDVDWLLAHGTGTTAGDGVEIGTLKTVFGDGELIITSNKSLLGHTGWSAGVLSVIQAVIGLRHGNVPAQRPHPRPPAGWDLPASFTIPDRPLPWSARPGTPRVAAVNSFGFGGTNAHAVVAEHIPAHASNPRALLDDPVVIVGHHVLLPGDVPADRVAEWLSGRAPAPPGPAVFDVPPEVPFPLLRLPAPARDIVDLAHRLALLAVAGLPTSVTRLWEAHRDTSGVIGGHFGYTAQACRYTSRLALDDIERGVVRPLEDTEPDLRAAFDAFAGQARAAVGPGTEDSYPAGMPGLVPARVGAALDFHGLVMSTDAGTASGLAALRLAYDYLSTGTLDVALVVAANGNALPSWSRLVHHALDGVKELAHGAVCFALTRQRLAERHGLDVLARLPHQDLTAAAPLRPSGVCGDRSYLGVDSAFEVLAHLHAGRSGTVEWTDPVTARTSRLTLDMADRVHRFVVDNQPVESEPTVRATGALPPDCVIVTDEPGALPVDEKAENSVVLSVVPGPGATHVVDPDRDTVRAAMASFARPPRHVRVLAGPGEDRLHALHELAFLCVQETFDGLAGGSVAILLRDAFAADVPVPGSGLFSGFATCLAAELPQTEVLCLVTATTGAQDARRELDAEFATGRATPVVLRRGTGTRLEPRAVPADAAPDKVAAPLTSDDVVVSVGGSRGITAVLLDHLARTAQPRIWVFGRAALDTTADAPEPVDLTTYLRRVRASHPEWTVPRATAEYHRQNAERESLAVLRALRSHCGPDRVTYVSCDVRDAAAVRAAIGRVLAEDGRIDLLLFAAGVNRSRVTPAKGLADFRAVRDTKVLGHMNLTRALASAPPRRWVNFGSLSALEGQPGELDYSSANDYLATAAAHARERGLDQFTIGWPTWAEAGLAADPVMRRRHTLDGLGAVDNRQGVELFARELAHTSHFPYTILTTASDRTLIDRRFPRIWAVPADPGEPPLLGQRRAAKGGDTVFDCHLDTASTDGHLHHHLVDGRPTVPGSFLIELAVEAAGALHPSLVPAEVRDGQFIRFLRPHPRTGELDFQVNARTVRSADDEVHVAVTVTTEVRTPSGRVVNPSQVHTTCTVVCTPDTPTPVVADHLTPVTGGSEQDPYYTDNPGIALTDVFVTTADIALDGEHTYGRFAPSAHIARGPFHRFRIPALLLDGLTRITAHHERADDSVPLLAMRSFRRITFHQTGSDEKVAGTVSGPIHLHSVPEPGNGTGPAYRCAAVDGTTHRLVLEVEGFTAHAKAFVPR